MIHITKIPLLVFLLALAGRHTTPMTIHSAQLEPELQTSQDTQPDDSVQQGRFGGNTFSFSLFSPIVSSVLGNPTKNATASVQKNKAKPTGSRDGNPMIIKRFGNEDDTLEVGVESPKKTVLLALSDENVDSIVLRIIPEREHVVVQAEVSGTTSENKQEVKILSRNLDYLNVQIPYYLIRRGQSAKEAAGEIIQPEVVVVHSNQIPAGGISLNNNVPAGGLGMIDNIPAGGISLNNNVPASEIGIVAPATAVIPARIGETSDHIVPAAGIAVVNPVEIATSGVSSGILSGISNDISAVANGMASAHRHIPSVGISTGITIQPHGNDVPKTELVGSLKTEEISEDVKIMPENNEEMGSAKTEIDDVGKVEEVVKVDDGQEKILPVDEVKIAVPEETKEVIDNSENEIKSVGVAENIPEIVPETIPAGIAEVAGEIKELSS